MHDGPPVDIHRSGYRPGGGDSSLLKENAADSQFLMISLKDVMVHNADRIYGVFAQNGRSRVLALPMKEAKVAA